jgi:hypothetical protein
MLKIIDDYLGMLEDDKLNMDADMTAAGRRLIGRRFKPPPSPYMILILIFTDTRHLPGVPYILLVPAIN